MLANAIFGRRRVPVLACLPLLFLPWVPTVMGFPLSEAAWSQHQWEAHCSRSAQAITPKRH